MSQKAKLLSLQDIKIHGSFVLVKVLKYSKPSGQCDRLITLSIMGQTGGNCPNYRVNNSIPSHPILFTKYLLTNGLKRRISY